MDATDRPIPKVAAEKATDRTCPLPRYLLTNCAVCLTLVPAPHCRDFHLALVDLFEASKRGVLDRVQALISTGANTANDRDEGAEAPRTQGVMRPDRPPHVSGWRSRSQTTLDKVTALHWAAINNHIAVAKYLLEQGADVNALGGDLVATPLHWAVRPGHVSMVRTLIEAGADLELRDRQGFTPLHTAAQVGLKRFAMSTAGVP